MTPFMWQVAHAVAAGRAFAAPEVPTRVSTVKPRAVAAEDHVAVRAVAEQLICEANAVLADQGARLVIEDRPGGGQLAFEMRYRGHRTRITTRFDGAVAHCRVDGLPDGHAEAVELAGPQAVAPLILWLLSAEPAATRS